MAAAFLTRWRALIAGTAAVAMLVAGCPLPTQRPDSMREWRAPSHAKVLADTASIARASTLPAKKPRFEPRLVLPAANLPKPPLRRVSRVLRNAGPRLLPPARRRYRRVTHDADGDPPA